MSSRSRFARVVCLWAAVVVWSAGCTTEEAGTSVTGNGGSGATGGGTGGGAGGGTGGNGAGGTSDAAVDAPIVQVDGGAPCNTALDKGLGSACACGDECASGFCADGVCCNTQCNGACVACNQPSNAGECRAVRSGVQDPHGVCTKEAVETCGRDGTCNGQGACARHGAGVVCRPAACSGSGLTPASSCDGNGTCLSGAPINCSPSLCVNGACKLVCAGPGDCAPPHDCTAGSCGLRGLGQPCDRMDQCKSGYCVDGVCCDSACTGKCTSCGLPPSLGRCVAVGAGAPDPRAAAGVTDPARICADEGTASCGTNGRCDGAGGCQRYAEGTTCKEQSCDPATDRWTAASTCSGGACVTPAARGCAPNRCSGNRCGGTCTTSANCAPGNDCIAGSCGKKPQGQLCARDGECASNYCSQGVCCNGRCDGVCQACNLAGSQGVCIAVPPGGDDPTTTCRAAARSTCGDDGTCNGKGGCRKYVLNTVCADARCSNGMVTSASTCNGNGVCIVGTTRSCAGIMCDPTRPQCLSGCSRDSQCIAPNTCQSGKCGQSDPGGTCEESADCKQTPNPQFCVQGICCNVSSCSGCRTCATGTCANVMAGRPPTNSSCAVNLANPICGNNGTCDGTGKCTVAAPGTSCGAICSGDSRVPRTCPGNGATCASGTPISCGTFTCEGGVCLTGPCGGNDDCAAGLVCSSGSCKVPIGGSCATSSQCTTGTPCIAGKCCNCPNPNACTDAGCSAMGVCNYKMPGTACSVPVCNAASDGTVVQTCNGSGTCTGGMVTTPCPAAMSACQGGMCLAAAAPGEMCTANAHCLSGACLGGRCCSAACTAADAACAALSCNSSGACVFPGAPVTCGTATCPTPGSASKPVCDGAGTCSAMVTTCGTGLACRNGACPMTCMDDDDCLPEYTCRNQTVCKKRPGQGCANGGECASGNCFDNFCCNDGCVASDQNCGFGCQPSGACIVSASGDVCAGPVCSGDSVQVSKCNGSGVCQPQIPQMCGPGLCMNGACLP